MVWSADCGISYGQVAVCESCFVAKYGDPPPPSRLLLPGLCYYCVHLGQINTFKPRSPYLSLGGQEGRVAWTGGS